MLRNKITPRNKPTDSHIKDQHSADRSKPQTTRIYLLVEAVRSAHIYLLSANPDKGPLFFDLADDVDEGFVVGDKVVHTLFHMA